METQTAFTRKQLYELVWQKSMVQLAKDYAISDRGLAKLCARYDIPTPPRGYWALLEVGRAPARPALPPSKNQARISLPSRVDGDGQETHEEIVEAVGELKDPEKRIVVAERLSSPCDLVAQSKAALQAAEKDYLGFLQPPANCLAMHVSPDALPRALRIADRLIKALRERGWNVTAEQQDTTRSTM